jgi:ADP-dependent phosphofructokinase/glucokinase
VGEGMCYKSSFGGILKKDTKGFSVTIKLNILAKKIMNSDSLKSVIEKGSELATELTRHNVFTKGLTFQIKIHEEEKENTAVIDKLLKRSCINFDSRR